MSDRELAQDILSIFDVCQHKIGGLKQAIQAMQVEFSDDHL